MIPKKTIHFVNDQQLCDKQYANYREGESFKAGQAYGRKEVVEWVDANVHWRKDAPYKSTIDPDEWQAQKKKKWGIDV